MVKTLLFVFIAFISFSPHLEAQGYDYVLFKKHDPKRDSNLSPATNPAINPDSNQTINPVYNWNINPFHNNDVSPAANKSINPMVNSELNPQINEVLHPVFMKSLLPANPSWNGLYMFTRSNEIFGYISLASQYVMLSFDNNGSWNGYFVKAGRNTYNFFNVFGVWTGMFLCYDNASGFNFFDKSGKWTGMHIK